MGSTQHNLLRTKFNNHVISRRGRCPLAYSQQRIDALELFPCCALKDKVYADNHQTDQSKQNIRVEIAQTDHETVVKVLQNCCSRRT